VCGQAGKDGDFITQAALGSLTARPTNNIVDTKSFYDVVFLTGLTGAIKTIQVTFPAGTVVPTSAFFNEAEGIGPGTVSKSGQTITYTVTNAVSIPAGTKIRLEFANINNPANPSTSYQVTVTTRNAANGIIDGPTQSTAYSIKQIGTSDIADNAVTTPKIADGSITSSKLAFDVDPPRTATLTVKKIVVNNVGGPFPTASDFLIDVNGENPLPTRFPGSASGVTVFLAPGPYAVTEDRIPQDGFGPYFTTYSQDCVGVISDGESKECIVTNTRQ
jgi:prealbumin domain-containing protein